MRVTQYWEGYYMGPDLVPHFIQYQSSQTSRELMLRQRGDLSEALGQGHVAWAMLKLGLSWRVLRSQLGTSTQDGMLNYREWVQELVFTEPTPEIMHFSPMLGDKTTMFSISRPSRCK
ncbi:hypothetical protein NHX12_027545 [Muraenolepis orangiensis]|uniref:Uncharacterized protein n=1 Tax=Muraenolepis orangiensis TaxID=630683 RepID=A0A9Q0INZ0_9TELE|nr:hypothetical protein NHX12_027545 [Muraenolepis orangiensis]